MWNWIFSETQKAVKALPFGKNVEYATASDKDDLVSSVITYLIENPKLAKDIYKNKKIGVLYQLARYEVFEKEREMCCAKNKWELSRYKKIAGVCEKYDIEPIPKNAYKISALLEDKAPDYNISGVAALLAVFPLLCDKNKDNQVNL